MSDESETAMVVTVPFGPWNPAKFKFPYIGVVRAWEGDAPATEPGQFIGGPRHGGEAEVLANVGDVVRFGQRDMEGRGKAFAWGVVEVNGDVRTLSRSEARRLFRLRAGGEGATDHPKT